MTTKKQAVASGEKAALVLVADGTCYNPVCSAPLLVQRDGRKVINFEFAHIRDELPPSDPAADVGWRYWPDDLSQDERNRYSNLILLCSACHKLVDQIDPRKYSVHLLRDWKRGGETRAIGSSAAPLGELRAEELRQLLVDALAPRLDLNIPQRTRDPDPLSFADRLIEHVGRATELRALQQFLADNAPFSWWLVAGAAGTGKSRLALELCIAASASWHAGFLSESNQEALLDYEAARPTLVIVDYAAARAAWLGKVLHALATRADGAGADTPPTRLLILERAEDPDWLDVALLRKRHHESTRILAHQYATPLSLTGFADSDLLSAIERTAKHLEKTPSSTDLEDIANHALSLDQDAPPLIAIIATIDWYDGPGGSTMRDQALRTLLARRSAQQADAIPDPSLRRRARQLELIATTIGGVAPADYFSILESSDAPGLDLPDSVTLSPAVLSDILKGIRPDLLGELDVLDSFAGPSVQREITRRAVEIGWRLRNAGYIAFVHRTARDHPTHPHLPDLLRLDISSADRRRIWFPLVSSATALLRSPGNPNFKVIMSTVIDAARHNPGPDADIAISTCQYHFGNLLFSHSAFTEAITVYTRVIDGSDAAWAVHAASRTNRAVASMCVDEPERALADLDAVINSPQADDEARACCLNNRADIHRDNGDLAASIEDRSAVLALASTTYNRRFIALVRRAFALWTQDEHARAIDDIEAILQTPDITVEQKMSARVTRAEWRIARNDIHLAWDDIEAVLSSHRNFPGVYEQAQMLAAELA